MLTPQTSPTAAAAASTAAAAAATQAFITAMASASGGLDEGLCPTSKQDGSSPSPNGDSGDRLMGLHHGSEELQQVLSGHHSRSSLEALEGSDSPCMGAAGSSKLSRSSTEQAQFEADKRTIYK